ncbi:hypothetical protein HC752_09275 [Vibrio sp. S9_S30]|uniref:hypothetical protein n=1 Tax=Vibrio sp. S9_S30 TaxID=2720226 RepID=UPI0016807BEC|nr:hypothetical protein [Vibrio sp. S9_S30]MBD1557130.1 hypothetical protein [Vibrio sp. S9_S30]
MIKAKCILLLTVILSFSTWAEQNQVHIPGTSASMEQPVGFELSDAFAGFIHAKNNSSVVVMELPLEAFDQLSVLFSDLDMAKQGFGKQGLAVLELSSVELDGYKAPIVIGTQAISGVSVDKYIVLFKGQKTVMVTYNIMGQGALDKAAVMNSIKNIQIGKASSLSEKVALLPFTFEPEQPFNIADVMGNSTVSLTTFDGIDKSGEKPLLVIASSITQSRILNQSKHAKTLLKSIKGFEEHTIVSEGKVNFVGKEGYKIVAEANNQAAIQYIGVLDNGYYVRLLSMGSAKEIEKVKKAVDAIAKSVNPK